MRSIKLATCGHSNLIASLISVLETTTMGVPMIAWPLYVEQPFNSKFVVDEIQIALEAPQRID